MTLNLEMVDESNDTTKMRGMKVNHKKPSKDNKSSFKDIDKSALFFVGYQNKCVENRFYDNGTDTDQSFLVDEDFDENENQDDLDELECDLLNENFAVGGSSSAGGARPSSLPSSFGGINSSKLEANKKMNFSSRVENDITRSEKKSEKRVNYYGRDDRATSEQVMDPRTRLILFKLLSNGYLSEIDGRYFKHAPIAS
jgi:hypothetical protein